MLRLALAPMVFLLLACGGEETPREPESVLIADDSTGRIFDGAVPSPDGTRLAFTKVVDGGKSTIFVSAPDGSNPVRITRGVWDVNPVWSPDGKWIAYQGEDPAFDLYIVASDGSAPARLLSGGFPVDNPTQWLHDGSGVLFNRAGAGDMHPMAVAVSGGAPRRVGPVMQGDLHAAWSPDGSMLGFDVHQGDGSTLWVQDSASGSTPRRMTSEGLESGAVATMWSPDGKQIAYISRRTGTDDIWILDVANGQTRQLTNDVRDDNNPRWSPDGRWIAFTSERGGQRDLWLVPSAGGTAVRVTNSVDAEIQPRWARDGNSLYYLADRTATELQLVPLAGGPARVLRSWGPEAIIDGARLSPDGKTVLYWTNRSTGGDIFSLPIAGGEPALFASSPRFDADARFSPDGSTVAFVSERGGSRDVWIVPAAGGEPRNLTASPGNESAPAWSPDGKQIAFASNRDVGGADLWVIDLAGGGPRRLTQDNLRPELYQWSPDGRYLYFSGFKSSGSEGRDVFRVPAAGGRPEGLGAKATSGLANLSRDGNQIAYSSFERGWAFIHLVPASGGPSRRLTSDTSNVYHLMGTWGRGDSLLVVSALDLAANRDAGDVFTIRMPDGRWDQLTHTPGFEMVEELSADGRQILVIVRTSRNQIRRVSVADLVSGR